MSILILLAATMTQTDVPLAAGDHSRKIVVARCERSYLIHAPPKYDPTKPWPVVLAFHGGGSNPAQMAHFSGLDEKADEAGFILVLPSGSGRVEQMLTWNAGNCCGYAQQENIDDVAFVRQLLDDLPRIANVDADRIFATGMSNGGMMAYRLASELSDRIAAVAPVGGADGDERMPPAAPCPSDALPRYERQIRAVSGRSRRAKPVTDQLSVGRTFDRLLDQGERVSG